MDHAPLKDMKQGSAVRYREHSDKSVDKKALDSSWTPTQNVRRPIRRVRSPSRPRAWLSSAYKPKVGVQHLNPRFPGDDHSFHKPGFSNHRHKPFNYFHRRNYHQPKLSSFQKCREWDKNREEEKERYEHQRDGVDGSPPPKQSKGQQSNSNRPLLHKPSSSRDKDKQITVPRSDRSQSRESDHKRNKSKEREQSRDGELPSTASQTVARDRAIRQKRREIDEVYHQECEMFGFVVKMLIEKDPSLEVPIQASLQKNLRDIGTRCVEAMERFIEEYDSKGTPQ